MLRTLWPFGRKSRPVAEVVSDTLKRKTDWEREGFVVLPGFYDHMELDAAEAEVARVWKSNAPRVVVDDMDVKQRLRLADVGEEARRSHRFKINDLYLELDSVRRLALNARITPILSDLLGHTPVLCNSLNFELGSEQDDHVDSLYMTPRSERHLIAIWVALEDCHLDAGPLRYYPGSHEIPQYIFSTGSHHFVKEEMPLWSRYMQEQIATRGLMSKTFPARKGDVFIWSAYLLHGGSPIRDRSRTRKSIVFHYYSDDDCRSNGCTLMPYEGAYWLHRRHQPVPGLGDSEAPPI